MKRLAVLLACSAGCGPAPHPSRELGVPWASSGVDWTTPPPVTGTTWTPPAIAEATLPNGVRVIVVENHRLPLIEIEALHASAGSREAGDHPGLAAITLDLLDDATGALTAARLSRALETQGAHIETSIATDHATQDLVTRARALRPTLELLAEIVQRPAFADADVARLLATHTRELTEQRTQTRRIAAQVFDRVVFGTHVYAQPAAGTPESVAAVTAADVRTFWQHAYRPDALTLIVAGDTTLADARDAVAATFGDWQPLDGAPVVPPPLPAYAAQLAYVDIPGATEANVIVGRRTARAGEPNQLAADVANAAIGGGTDGRLDRELHAKSQLTFGASASFWRGSLGGAWAAAATFATPHAADGIRAMLAVIASPPSADELARATRNLLAGARSSFDTTAGTVHAVERLLTQRQPLDRYASLATRLAALSAADVRDALSAQDLSVVVVGDWSKLADPLRTLGLTPTPYTP